MEFICLHIFLMTCAGLETHFKKIWTIPTEELWQRKFCSRSTKPFWRCVFQICNKRNSCNEQRFWLFLVSQCVFLNTVKKLVFPLFSWGPISGILTVRLLSTLCKEREECRKTVHQELPVGLSHGWGVPETRWVQDHVSVVLQWYAMLQPQYFEAKCSLCGNKKRY